MERILNETIAVDKENVHEVIHEVGRTFEKWSAEHDHANTFVRKNYETLKEIRIFSAAIPRELGGGGVSHSDMCEMLRILAGYCSSTALALSMHQHLIAATVWKYKRGLGGEILLRKVVDSQLVLVSTGAGDWLTSNGTLARTTGGYLLTARKHFSSQAPVGNILITSAVYEDPEKGAQVLHFPVPMNTKGLTVMDNWDALGMRGTGSHSIALDRVFVPDESIVLTRKRGEYHPFFNVILTAAMPLIMSVYVGVSEKAARLALKTMRKNPENHTPYPIAEMINELTTARTLWKDMVSIANDLDFEPRNENGNAIAVRKTIVADACIKTLSKAMEACGGKSYLREMELERLYRDVLA